MSVLNSRNSSLLLSETGRCGGAVLGADTLVYVLDLWSGAADIVEWRDIEMPRREFQVAVCGRHLRATVVESV